MLGRRRTHLTLEAGLLVSLLLLLSGCTFWVRMADGQLVPVTLPDQEAQMFFMQMDGMSNGMLSEAKQLRNDDLKQSVVELREAYFRLMRQMGSDRRTSVNPFELQNKMKKLELQLAGRLRVPQQAQRYRALKNLFDQLQRDTHRFFSLIGL
jgi:hypothetical protein